MLPIPKLDTQSFKEIYETMRHLMEINPKYDESYQDPGQTLLELFALLFDMQHFYMDYITDEHREKYARLLGAKPVKLSFASTMLEVFNDPKIDVLPVGSIFYAKNIPFETNEILEFSANELESVISIPDGSVTMLKLGFKKDLNRYPAKRIYLGFDRPVEPLFQPMDSWDGTYIDENGSHQKIELPGRHLNGGFLSVTVKNPVLMENGRYWLYLTMKSDFEISPKIEFARINVVKACQVKTWCDYVDAKADDSGRCRVYSHLAFNGSVEILGCLSTGGIRTLDRSEYTIDKHEREGYVICTIEEHEHYSEYRILYWDNNFQMSRIIKTNTAPGQSIRLSVDGIDDDSIELMTSGENGYWTKWTRVTHFYGSRSTDTHFTVQNGSIRFGNHERGEMLPTGKLMIVRCKSSLGADGNIRMGEMDTNRARNITPSSGGASKQNGPLRAVADDMLYKAVTLEDYKAILRGIPILQLDRVDAAAETIELGKNATAVCIYVKPDSERDFPVINDAYVKNILAYLEPYRIITEKLIVRAVVYIPFSIKLSVEFYPEYSDAQDMVIGKLLEIFPYKSLKNCPHREFGERITYREIYSQVRGATCIKKIISLCVYLNVDGQDGRMDEVTFIQLKPGQLAYLSDVEFIKPVGGWV